MRLVAILTVAVSLSACTDEVPMAGEISGDPDAGAALLEGYRCGSCHVIPGVPLAEGREGPMLDHYSRRAYVAGVLPNTPEDLATWIVDPKAVDPRTTMPDLDVAPQQARDMAAYLYLKTGH